MAYIGNRMSENAAHAYWEGLKPLSKWTKSEIIEEINLPYNFKKVKKAVLANYFLCQTEWHHTGSFYQKTYFYGLNEEHIESFNEEKYFELLEASKIEKEPTIEEPLKYVKAYYQEWSGSRNHPKKTDVYEFGQIKGDWFHGLSGSKKKASGNWFSIREEYSSETEMLKAKAEEDLIHQKQAEEAEAKAKALQEKKKASEEKKRLYQAYITEYPDVTIQKFCKNQSMIGEAKIIMVKHIQTYKQELKVLVARRGKQEITNAEFRNLRNQLYEKYYYIPREYKK